MKQKRRRPSIRPPDRAVSPSGAGPTPTCQRATALSQQTPDCYRHAKRPSFLAPSTGPEPVPEPPLPATPPAETGSPSIETLVETYAYLVGWTIRTLVRPRPSRVLDYDDHYMAGMLGLMSAAERWDGRRPFPTYAVELIAGAIRHQIRDQSGFPGWYYERMGSVFRAMRQLEGRNRTLTPESIARSIGTIRENGQTVPVTPEMVEAWQSMFFSVYSLEDLCRSSETPEEPGEWASAVPAAEPAVDTAERLDLQEAILRLPPRHAHLIVEHYYRHRSLEELAEEMSLNAAHLATLMREALAYLNWYLSPSYGKERPAQRPRLMMPNSGPRHRVRRRSAGDAVPAQSAGRPSPLTLTEPLRLVLLLRFRDHLQIAEIAKKLGRPKGTVSTWLHMLKKHLQAANCSPEDAIRLVDKGL